MGCSRMLRPSDFLGFWFRFFLWLWAGPLFRFVAVGLRVFELPQCPPFLIYALMFDAADGDSGCHEYRTAYLFPEYTLCVHFGVNRL